MKDSKRDTLLFQQIKAGNEGAFEELFNLYYENLCNVAFRVYRDQHKSQDFVQEVFLSIWKKRKSLEIKSSVYAYLRKAVMYKSIDFIRAQKLTFPEGENKEEPFYEVSDTLAGEELKNIIHKTVDELPDRCRLIFCLSRFEELSHKEIALKLNISHKTIENQITKALKALRTAVKNYGLPLKLFLILSPFV